MDGINRARIRGIIAEKGLTLKDLSGMTGFTQATLSNFLNGNNPSYRLMKALGRALELTAEESAAVFFAHDIRSA